MGDDIAGHARVDGLRRVMAAAEIVELEAGAFAAIVSVLALIRPREHGQLRLGEGPGDPPPKRVRFLKHAHGLHDRRKSADLVEGARVYLVGFLDRVAAKHPTFGGRHETGRRVNRPLCQIAIHDCDPVRRGTVGEPGLAGDIVAFDCLGPAQRRKPGVVDHHRHAHFGQSSPPFSCLPVLPSGDLEQIPGRENPTLSYDVQKACNVSGQVRR